MNYFWNGFEKVAYLSILEAAGSGTDRAKEHAKVRAESIKRLVEDSVKTRKTAPLEYAINPAVPGPLSEGLDRLMRRHFASRAEHPLRTSLIPGYGMIRGGKAGTPKD